MRAGVYLRGVNREKHLNQNTTQNSDTDILMSGPNLIEIYSTIPQQIQGMFVRDQSPKEFGLY